MGGWGASELLWTRWRREGLSVTKNGTVLDFVARITAAGSGNVEVITLLTATGMV